MNQSFEELVGSIIEWANNRNLLQKDNSKNQYIKATEELAEVGKALLNNDHEGLIDGIGDTFVTLIILAEQNGLSPVDCLNSAYNEIKDRKGKTLNGTFIKDESSTLEIDNKILKFHNERDKRMYEENLEYIRNYKPLPSNLNVTTSNSTNYTLTNDQINRIIESKGAEGIN